MKLISASLGFVLAGTLTAQAAGFEVLAPHRATYEVKLVNAEERSGIEGMDGRIVYELKGSECEGISIQYRFVTRINTGRDTFVTDQQSASYESPDGKEFSFSTKSFVNDQADQNVSGSAMQTDTGIKVVHGGAEPKELELGDGVFTSTHLMDIMRSAKEGEAFVSHTVFDGAGDADKILKSATVIGKEKTVKDAFDGEDGVQTLLNQSAWPVTMSYFETVQDNSAESLPIYEASFLLYKNGITRDLTMRYPDYELKATLSGLELLDRTAC
ncbi:MAG: DUF1849 family protein [Rhizobiaceae bacterium]|nr:DUF1849 family protein [Rhizobiaceae bacterium]